MSNYNLTPTNDIIFKRLFGSKGNEEILKDLLESLLDIKIESLSLDLATEMQPDFYSDKGSRLDIRTKLSDGTNVNVEMQVDKNYYSEKRCLEYWSKLYSNGFNRGDDYNNLTKTICIWILADQVYDDFESYESTWKLAEKNMGFNEHFGEIEFHIIELKKFRKLDIMKPKKKEFWLWFIDHINEEMIEMGCIDNERIKEAREQLEKITSDPELMDIIRREDLYASDQTTMMNKAIKEGMKKGREEGSKEKEFEIAKKMKIKGIDVNMIMELTGLSEEEIQKL